jgi:hypothetical protein
MRMLRCLVNLVAYMVKDEVRHERERTEMSVALDNLTVAVDALIAKVQSTSALQTELIQVQTDFAAEQAAEQALADKATAAANA